MFEVKPKLSKIRIEDTCTLARSIIVESEGVSVTLSSYDHKGVTGHSRDLLF